MGFFNSVSQLVDDVLNSTMDSEIENKISEAAESFKRATNVTSGPKDLPSNDPVANQNPAGAVTKEMAIASASDMSRVLVTDALEGHIFPKVGVYYCRTSYG